MNTLKSNQTHIYTFNLYFQVRIWIGSIDRLFVLEMKIYIHHIHEQHSDISVYIYITYV